MMLPLLSLRQALTAAATASATFLFMDANPSLWIFDKFIVTDSRLQREFAGKRIWITGASSGIGAELAQQLAACDAELILSGRNVERLKAVAATCGGTARVVPMDLDCSETEMQSVISQIGPIDCAVLNAGIGQQMPATQTSREETEKQFRINSLAPIHWTQSLLNQPNPPSQLVVTMSVASKFAVPLSASYAASKHAVSGYFSTLSAELPHLRITLPCPGPVATPFFGKKPTSKERKMGAGRCARLVLSSMVMGGETWIAQQPTLLFCYLNQHFPGFANALLRRFLGPTRIAMWEAGLNIYDPASISKLRKIQKEKKRKD